MERKSWTTAQNWLEEAACLGEKIPILFGDATDCSRLTHWALLDDVHIDDGETRFSFSRLKRFRPVRATHDLRLVSTNEKLSRDYIRPYALVRTPSDLIDAL